MSEHEEDQAMNDVNQLLARFEDLNRRITQNSEERHRVNNQINAAITNIVNQIEDQDAVLATISTNIRALADSVARLEQCLIGDPKFERLGLIKEVNQLQAKNVALELRVVAAEEAARLNAAELQTQKRMVIWTATILATIGALITWFKNLIS